MACGSSDPPCSKVVGRICQIACNCGDRSCDTQFSDGTIVQQSQAECNTTFTSTCENSQVDTKACDDALNGVECSDNALPIPSSCT